MNVTTLTESFPISVDRNILSGTPVFAGTRVPIRTLFDYIADGNTLDEFLENFPSVSREQALKLLDFVTNNLPFGVQAR